MNTKKCSKQDTHFHHSLATDVHIKFENKKLSKKLVRNSAELIIYITLEKDQLNLDSVSTDSE